MIFLKTSVIRFFLPETCDRPIDQIPDYKYVVGSSLGWLILCGRPDIILLNPLSREKIKLPPITTFPGILSYDPSEEIFLVQDYVKDPTVDFDKEGLVAGPIKEMNSFSMKNFIKKVVLSSSPLEEEDWSALSIGGEGEDDTFTRCGKILAIAKKDRWLLISHRTASSPWMDILFSKGFFYAINKYGIVLTCTKDGCVTRFTDRSEQPIYDNLLRYEPVFPLGNATSTSTGHLAVYNGEILLVVARRKHYSDPKLPLPETYLKISDFRLYKLDKISSKVVRWEYGEIKSDYVRSHRPEWINMEILQDQMLFLGQNSTICHSASAFPRSEPNSIYFICPLAKGTAGLIDFLGSTFQRYTLTKFQNYAGYTLLGDHSPHEILLPPTIEGWVSTPELVWFEVGSAGGDTQSMPEAAEGLDAEDRSRKLKSKVNDE